MISALTLVSLGLLQTGTIEIVTVNESSAPASAVIDPATADVADIDAAVKDYAIPPSSIREFANEEYDVPPVTKTVIASDEVGDDSSSSANLEEPAQQPQAEAPPVSLADQPQPNKANEEFDLEGLKLDKPFIVLRFEDRPSWVEQPAQLKGDGEHFISVASDPWKTDFEAGDSLEKKLRTAVNDYINDQIGRTDAAQRIRLPQESLDQLVGQRYVEDLQFADTSIGAMKQMHARLVFTPQFRAEIAERWKEHVVNARLLRTGVGAAGVLVLMVMAFGVLKRLGRR